MAAIILGFFHVPTALPASVNGTNNKLKPATSNKTPMTSNSVHKVLKNMAYPWDLHGYSGSRPALEALRWLIQRDAKSGKDSIGVIIALNIGENQTIKRC